MPELPDIVVYIEALSERTLGREVRGVRVSSPAVLRTYRPAHDAPVGRTVEKLHRVGKRIVFQFDPDLYLVIHLMVAGRLRWDAPHKVIPKKAGLAAVDFREGSLILTERGVHKRAGIWLLEDWSGVEKLDRGGVEPMEATLEEFSAAIRTENRTLKRALTDPRFLSGIGNSYSDEILWRARMSPFKRTGQLSDDEVAALRDATVAALAEWTATLRNERSGEWPKKVTAFRPDMAVHGKYGDDCPRCGSPVQRIVYASNETNYCATCQTGGKLLADRSMSRLLKDDWPKTLEELDET